MSTQASEVESFSYDDGIVRKFVSATIIWGLLACCVGAAAGLLLCMPSLFGGAPEWLSFGRIRPVHTNTALFAFLANGIFAAVYYSTQRLCKARMWSRGLSHLHFWGWQLVVLATAITIPMGMTQGKEYAEAQWPIDVAISVLWLLVFGVNFAMTIKTRRERHLYVSLWFYSATIIAVGFVHVVNNLAIPMGWQHSHGLFAGVQDALMQWWYGHNAITFLMTMPFLGLMYYILPKASGQPIHSYRWCIVHFWSLLLITVWAGPHHLHYTALPDWASSLGMIFGLLLWFPSLLMLLNGVFTLQASKKAGDGDAAVLPFVAVALVFYGIATIEGPLLAIKSINALTHFTDWTIAHAHSAALGWNGFLLFAMIYWLVPRLFQVEWARPGWIKLHFWIGLVGVLLCVMPSYAAGLYQSLMLLSLDELGNLNTPDFMETMPVVRTLWWAAMAGGIVYTLGLLLMATNVLLTWLKRPAEYRQSLCSAAPLSRDSQLDEAGSDVVESNYGSDVPVLEMARKLDRLGKFSWHRRWERTPSKMTFLIIVIVVAASFLELAPMLAIRSNVTPVATVKPYTPLELMGRQMFLAEGCFNCHSQMIRPLVSETKRYGDYSQGGEFVYDRPFQWGSRRIGPDLARVGGKYDSFWHWQHLDNPSAQTDGSVMPSFSHLLDRRLKPSEVRPHLQVLADLGVPYTDSEIENCEEAVRRQAEEIAAEIVAGGGPAAMYDRQAVALIAYLQRLGTDLNRVPEPEKPVADAAAQGAAE